MNGALSYNMLKYVCKVEMLYTIFNCLIPLLSKYQVKI